MLSNTTFKNPPSDFSIVPFWFWNDDLNEAHLLWQMDEMYKQHIKQFVIHSRKGITIEYLSDEWFKRVDLVIQKAQQLAMKVWIYDEDNWPSGYAGGKVLNENPMLQAKMLRKITIRFSDFDDKKYSNIVSIFYINNNQYNYINSIDQLNILYKQKQITDSTILIVFCIANTPWNPAYSNGFYIDVLNPEATLCFMKHTHYEYKKRFGKYFGKVIAGFFSDEAGFYNNLHLRSDLNDENTLPWTNEFPSFFEKVNHYSILDKLIYLWQDSEKSVKYRIDLWTTLCLMYKQNFLEPQRKFCENEGMKFIGHLHFEDYMHYQILTQGNMFTALESFSYAGTDRIDLNSEKINEKFISSIGHAYNKPRVLSETYALSGWGLTLEQQKQWLNYQYVRGINMIVPHALYSSIENERKWECPPSQFYQNPYWNYYHKFADYTARLSYMLSLGTHIVEVAIYYPITTAYQYLSPDNFNYVKQLDQFIQNISFTLLDNQIDFDFIDDHALCNSNINDNNLCINNEKFKILLLPALTNIPYSSALKIFNFVQKGGIVIFIQSVPEICPEVELLPQYSDLLRQLCSFKNVHFIIDNNVTKYLTYKFNISELLKIIENNFGFDVKLETTDNHIKYLHRRMDDTDIFFISNEDNAYRTNTIALRSTGNCFEFNCENGDIIKINSFEVKKNYTILPLKFAPFEAKLIVITKQQLNADKILNDIYTNSYCMVIKDNWELTIDKKTFKTNLKSWGEIGYSLYSGKAVYETIFTLPNFISFSKVILKLGKVYNSAEVIINNKNLGVCIWEPYEFEITEHLLEDKNKIIIIVTNTLYNQFEQKEKLSGLLGPVTIEYFE